MKKFSDIVEQFAWDMRETLKPLNEYTYDQLVAKQASISTIHPKFAPRVRAVQSHGGVRLSNVEPDKWSFTIASGTVPGKRYDAVVNFDNLMDIVSQQAQSTYLWTKDGRKIDLRKMARAVMEDGNLQLFCSCPADLYWGGQYIRTKRDSKYTEPETRRPKIRNPREYGAHCKHLQVLMDALPFYANTMAHFLKQFYSKQIIELENIVKQQKGIITQGAEFLKKKEAEQAAKQSAGQDGKFKKGSV